jgi:hypothetical protein
LPCVCFSVSRPSSFAQAVTSGTGAINGKVPTLGAVMPGVTVTITSPQQMGADGGDRFDGTYRFTAVTPGDYVVVFELAGFSTVRNEGIRVSLGSPPR